jgi:deaminated glutathione amidase
MKPPWSERTIGPGQAPTGSADGAGPRIEEWTVSGLRVALVQLSTGSDVTANLAAALDMARRGLSEGASLAALPELCLYRGPAAGWRESATDVPGPFTEPFAALAREFGAWLLVGSLAERSPDPARPYNTSVLLDPEGRVAATYRKRRLFDVEIENGPVAHESGRTTPGDRAVVVDLGSAAGGEVVRLGLSICFEVRFPELYRDLVSRGATILAVPADFAEATGRDHWEVLLRARAIENGAFVIAPAQFGGPAGAIPAHGRSIVVDPWGTVIAQAPDGPGVLVADLDMARVASIRRGLPTQPR